MLFGMTFTPPERFLHGVLDNFPASCAIFYIFILASDPCIWVKYFTALHFPIYIFSQFPSPSSMMASCFLTKPSSYKDYSQHVIALCDQ